MGRYNAANKQAVTIHTPGLSETETMCMSSSSSSVDKNCLLELSLPGDSDADGSVSVLMDNVAFAKSGRYIVISHPSSEGEGIF